MWGEKGGFDLIISKNKMKISSSQRIKIKFIVIIESFLISNLKEYNFTISNLKE